MMIDPIEFQIPQLEWEHIEFPIEISQLTFEKNDWGFKEDNSILVWRDDRLRLKGQINGTLKMFEKIDRDDFVGEGNIIEGQTITGRDVNNNYIEMYQCFIGGVSQTGVDPKGLAMKTEAEIIFDSIKIVTETHPNLIEKPIRFQWFVCKRIPANFNGSTKRYLKKRKKRIRLGIDLEDDTQEHLKGSSSSRDFCRVRFKEHDFIIGKVPDNLIPNDISGLCLEFRGNVKDMDEQMVDGTRNFVGFLLGNKLQNIGYSILDGEKVLERFAISLYEYPEDKSMPPIKFNYQYEWGNLGYLLNSHLPAYLELQKELYLGIVIDKAFIANNAPLGTNLPILASALETIIAKYFKLKKIKTFEYLSEKEYLSLIDKELKTISSKLQGVSGNDIIKRKIKGAFRKGPNEKTLMFFELIGLKIGEKESKSLALRNKMAHGSSDYSKKPKLYSELVSSRTYEVLFNRVILKLLGYEGYYIDYSVKGTPIKQIDRPAGEQVNKD